MKKLIALFISFAAVLSCFSFAHAEMIQQDTGILPALNPFLFCSILGEPMQASYGVYGDFRNAYAQSWDGFPAPFNNWSEMYAISDSQYADLSIALGNAGYKLSRTYGTVAIVQTSNEDGVVTSEIVLVFNGEAGTLWVFYTVGQPGIEHVRLHLPTEPR